MDSRDGRARSGLFCTFRNRGVASGTIEPDLDTWVSGWNGNAGTAVVAGSMGQARRQDATR